MNWRDEKMVLEKVAEEICELQNEKKVFGGQEERDGIGYEIIIGSLGVLNAYLSWLSVVDGEDN